MKLTIKKIQVDDDQIERKKRIISSSEWKEEKKNSIKLRKIRIKIHFNGEYTKQNKKLISILKKNLLFKLA